MFVLVKKFFFTQLMKQQSVINGSKLIFHPTAAHCAHGEILHGTSRLYLQMVTLLLQPAQADGNRASVSFLKILKELLKKNLK